MGVFFATPLSWGFDESASAFLIWQRTKKAVVIFCDGGKEINFWLVSDFGSVYLCLRLGFVSATAVYAVICRNVVFVYWVNA